MEKEKLEIYKQTVKNMFNIGFNEVTLYFSPDTLEEMLNLEKDLTEKKYTLFKKADIELNSFPGQNFKRYTLTIKQNNNLFEGELKHA